MKQTTLCYLERDGQYLMLHRVKKQHDENHDKWIGVGGKCEEGESPEECVCRETLEETGLTLTDYRYRAVITFVSDEWEGEYMHLFTATGWTGHIHECSEGVLEWLHKDALAALPFGIIVLQSVTAKGYDNSKKQFRVVGGSAILAGVLLLAVYMGLAYLGATVSGQYNGTIGRAQLVMAIVEALMGKVGMILFGVVVGLACVTTAIALTSSAAAYFAELCRGKVPYKAFVIAICVFSAVVSNLGLDRIVAVAAPVLDVIYPPTLVLIFISLLMPRMPDRVSRGACIGALITSVLCTLTAHGVNIPVVPSLPLYDLGLSWLIPAAVFGLAASLLPFRARSREKRIVPLPNEEH